MVTPSDYSLEGDIMQRRIAAAVAAFALASAVGTGIAGAAPAGRITICHGTASESNPYVEITVSENSFRDGHFDGVPNPSHGPNNHPDFILNPGSVCADGPGGGESTQG
jgi:hypothetical protein